MPKEENKSWRFVVDLLEMGRNIYDDNYPTMPLDRARDILSRAKFITKMDIEDAYFSVRLAPESRKLTAFAVNTPGLRGLYEFTRHPSRSKMQWVGISETLRRYDWRFSTKRSILVCRGSVYCCGRYGITVRTSR